MFTPQEVSERAFQKASFGGYNMSQVDEFLDTLTADYTSLYNENTVLKSKMKVLVDKVEEYRSTEEAMRKALMTAQKMADDMLKDAEVQKARILEEAQADATARINELSREVTAEEYRLQQARQSTAAFVEKVRSLQAQQEQFLNNLSELCPQTPAVDRVSEAVSEIDDNVQRLLAQAMESAAAEPPQPQAAQPAPATAEDLSGDTAEFVPITSAPHRKKDEEDPYDIPVRRFDFGDLQFGKDYEIQ